MKFSAKFNWPINEVLSSSNLSCTKKVRNRRRVRKKNPNSSSWGGMKKKVGKNALEFHFFVLSL